VTSTSIAWPDLGFAGHTATKLHPLQNYFKPRSGVKIHSLAHKEKYNPRYKCTPIISSKGTIANICQKSAKEGDAARNMQIS
jgi:hypothetical protein